MRKVIAGLISVAAAVAIVTPAGSQEVQPTPMPDPPTYWEKAGCQEVVKRGKFRKAVKRIYRHDVGGYGGHYTARPKITGDNKKRLSRKARCASNFKVTKHRREFIREYKAEWHAYRYLDRITTEGEWVLPSYIPYRESGYDYTAVNSSGCSGFGCFGAYQISGEWWGDECSHLYWKIPGDQHKCARIVLRYQGIHAWSTA